MYRPIRHFLVWAKLGNVERNGRHIKGHIERIKLCGSGHKSVKLESKAESIKEETKKKIYEGERKESRHW